jgi:tyrosyl-DNA phosphodiesterase 1
MEKIDWAMLTSANLSTQAWGVAPNAEGIAKISSFEIGVVVWPGLWEAESETRPESELGSRERKGEVEMVPVFGRDMPDIDAVGEEGEKVKVKVGWRMPYDLPLVKYGRDDEPWCATMDHEEPDWMGQVWRGGG